MFKTTSSPRHTETESNTETSPTTLGGIEATTAQHCSPHPSSPPFVPTCSSPIEKAHTESTSVKVIDSLTKAPCWRQRSSSSVSPVLRKSSDDAELMLCNTVKSDTSISSHGPLKVFFKTSPHDIKHEPKFHFSLNEKLTKQAMAQSDHLDNLELMSLSESSIESEMDNPKEKSKKKKGTKKKTFDEQPVSCPTDATGGFRKFSIANYQVIENDFTEEDNEGQSFRGEKSKSNSGRKAKQALMHTNTLPNIKDNQLSKYN